MWLIISLVEIPTTTIVVEASSSEAIASPESSSEIVVLVIVRDEGVCIDYSLFLLAGFLQFVRCSAKQ